MLSSPITIYYSALISPRVMHKPWRSPKCMHVYIYVCSCRAGVSFSSHPQWRVCPEALEPSLSKQAMTSSSSSSHHEKVNLITSPPAADAPQFVCWPFSAATASSPIQQGSGTINMIISDKLSCEFNFMSVISLVSALLPPSSRAAPRLISERFSKCENLALLRAPPTEGW